MRWDTVEYRILLSSLEQFYHCLAHDNIMSSPCDSNVKQVTLINSTNFLKREREGGKERERAGGRERRSEGGGERYICSALSRNLRFLEKA